MGAIEKETTDRDRSSKLGNVETGQKRTFDDMPTSEQSAKMSTKVISLNQILDLTKK